MAGRLCLSLVRLGRKKVSRQKVSAGDSAKLIAHLEQARARAQDSTDAPITVLTCYEAGRDGFWLHRVLQDNGIDNRIVDPATLLTDRKKKSAKTDKIDVRKILRALEPAVLIAQRGVLAPQRVHALKKHLHQLLEVLGRGVVQIWRDVGHTPTQPE